MLCVLWLRFGRSPDRGGAVLAAGPERPCFNFSSGKVEWNTRNLQGMHDGKECSILQGMKNI